MANRAHSTPIYNPSSLAQFRVMEVIKKQGQAVFIDGQGGDELLGGYPAYFPLFLQSLRKDGEWKHWWKELMQVGNTGMNRKEMLTRRLKLWAKTHYYTPQRLAQKKRKYLYESLTPAFRDAYFNHSSPVPPVKKELLNDALFESYTLFLGNILRWGEHSAASQGVECVMPLSDYPDLTEFVFSIPSSFKIHDGWNKYLLRKAMTGIVPDEIRLRKQKMGFYIPEQKWLDEIKQPLFDALQKMEDPEGCIRKKYILENMNRLYTPANPLYRQFIFRCYSYLLWRNSL
jgi:asparagine synthase (glutamine-hydrolysing)